jgi:hygromycin-B 7''-O-kinase
MLPAANTPEQYKSINRQDPVFSQAAFSLLASQNIKVSSTAFPSSGSLPVVFVNNTYVFKFFPPLYADESLTESKALQFLADNNCAAPRLISTGDIAGWKYVCMKKLSGQSLKELWPKLTENQRQKACHDIGSCLRKIHEINFPDTSFFKNDWNEFLTEQKKNCVERHTKIGLREDLLKQIPDFLNSVELKHQHISFLHTEVMKDHVFFDDKLKFQGFVDFEPSRIGAAEYDFASVGVFLTSGDRKALRAFFQGYGNLDQVTTKNFKRRALAYTLLHQYSNLKWYLEFMPNADTLDELAELWWAIE